MPLPSATSFAAAVYASIALLDLGEVADEYDRLCKREICLRQPHGKRDIHAAFYYHRSHRIRQPTSSQAVTISLLQGDSRSPPSSRRAR